MRITLHFNWKRKREQGFLPQTKKHTYYLKVGLQKPSDPQKTLVGFRKLVEGFVTPMISPKALKQPIPSYYRHNFCLWCSFWNGLDRALALVFTSFRYISTVYAIKVIPADSETEKSSGGSLLSKTGGGEKVFSQPPTVADNCASVPHVAQSPAEPVNSARSGTGDLASLLRCPPVGYLA